MSAKADATALMLDSRMVLHKWADERLGNIDVVCGADIHDGFATFRYDTPSAVFRPCSECWGAEDALRELIK